MSPGPLRVHTSEGEPMHRNQRRWISAGALAVMAMVAAPHSAQGQQMVSAGSTGRAGTPGSDASGSSDGTAGGSGGEILTPPGESHVTGDEGQPVHGGTLVYGIIEAPHHGWAILVTTWPMSRERPLRRLRAAACGT